MKKKEIISIWVGTLALMMWGINRYILMPTLDQGATNHMEYTVVAIMIFGAITTLIYFGYLLIMVYNKSRSAKK